MLKQSVILFLSCALLACAGTEEADNGDVGGRRDCITASSIRGYRVLDEQNLIVESSGRRQYHVVLQRRAYGLNNSLSIAFDSPTSRICSDFGDVVYRGPFGGRTESVLVRDIRLLSAEEEEDLLIRFGKKAPEIERNPAPREVEGAEVEELDPAASE